MDSLPDVHGLDHLSPDAAIPQQVELAQGLFSVPSRPWRGPTLSSVRLAHSRLARAQAALSVAKLVAPEAITPQLIMIMPESELVQAPELTLETPAELSEPLPGALLDDGVDCGSPVRTAHRQSRAWRSWSPRMRSHHS